MRRIHYVAYLVCPVITVLFSLMIGFVTMYIHNSIPPLFVFLSVQFYLNWYLVYSINKKAVIPFTMATCRESQCSGSKFWYCGKCKHYIRQPAHHCILCKKCFYYRDESANVFLVTLFNVSVSIACFSLVYGLWKLFTCLTGRQRYYPDDGKHQDVYQIFGSYGFLNVIFPFNGFLHSRSIDEKKALLKC
ncbi:hypothetical protein TSAR_015377 [Trichomalopsis sarcophagae]|uniref:Uncharacterized protein n=1 Tax=Trichomalopsis sarcophagae TaxID=543379 RepID=A0A232FCE9_9HYME|nr:hypothetical protein TSAR_015377 [Trichomalopsis sarcophagae]